MVKLAEGGAWSILTALAAAIAPAVVKALIARRRRAPIKMEEQEMCRNHSHLTGVLLEAISNQESAQATILVVQPVTLELLNGEKLMVPHYSVCLVWRDDATQSLGRQLHVTAEQGSAPLHKEGDLFSSGHIIQGR